MTKEEGKVNIVYYTDPLCCWSWVMEKEWTELKEQFGDRISYRYCMGGLLADWNHYHDDLNSISRPAQMGPMWMEASHKTGVPINNRIWIEDPPASSYLSCIAVKAAGLQSSAAEEIYLHELRVAVMTKGKNIAYESVLLDIARQVAEQHPSTLDHVQFSEDLRGSTAIEAFRRDLNEVQQRGINRFPALLFKGPVGATLMMVGYRPFDLLAAAVGTCLNSTPETSGTAKA